MTKLPPELEAFGILVPSHKEPVYYHELARVQAKYSRRRVFWAMVLAFVFWQLAQGLIVGIWLGVQLTNKFVSMAGSIEQLTQSDIETVMNEAVTRLSDLNPRDTALFVVFMLSAALVPLLIWIVTRMLTTPAFNYLSSIVGRFRWRLAVEAIIAAVLSLGIVFAVSAVLGGPINDFGEHLSTQQLVVGMLAIFLLVPLQAAGEEYFFRGMVTQWIGTLFRHPAWSILVPALLFGLVHGYSGWATASVVLMGAGLGYLTLRSGGIEMAIAFHTVNNWLAFGYSLLSGDVASQNGQNSTVLEFISTAVMLALFITWAEWRLRTHQPPFITALTHPLVQEP